MTTIGYIRVSSNKQTLEHQRFEIENFARHEGIKIDTWIEEKISSRKALNKRKLGELLDNLQENDMLITCEISRLGRSLLEVMKILETCLNKNCQVWTLKENYRLGNDIQSKVLAFAFGLAAEIERQLISERTKSSLANIKAQGKKLGRPYNSQTKNLRLAKNQKQIQKLLAQGISKSKIAKLFGVERATLRKYLLRLMT
ncbi:MAG: recombinase family protein [Alphaproteobacteria bacterium]|nr:recombinase family protein [Alphaproteobacteria bacterium]